ncbi:MAG: hypothetical protein WCO96_02335 [Actinomycetes bacterium]
MKRTAFRVAGVTLAIALPGCGGNGNVENFTLVQPSADKQTVDIAPSGPSKGDVLYWDGPLTENGKEVGHIQGATETIALPSDLTWTKQVKPSGSVSSATENLTLSKSTLFLGGDDTIISEGQIFYETKPGATIKSNVPQIRSIIGGTGKYKFARGQMTITKTATNAYEFRIEVNTGS